MKVIIDKPRQGDIKEGQSAENLIKTVFNKLDENAFAVLYNSNVNVQKLKELAKAAVLMVALGINEDAAIGAVMQAESQAEQLIDEDDLADFLVRVNGHYQATGVDLVKAELDKAEFGINNSSGQDKINKLMHLASKLVEAVPRNNEDFLWELLELAIENIPEADYGSISIIEGDVWRYAAAKGHNLELLKKIPLKPEYSLNFDLTQKRLSTNTYIIDNIIQADSEKMPKKIHKMMIEASQPIKQSLIAQIYFNGKCKGHICLDIAADNTKSFNEASMDIIKPIGDLASAYLMMRESYSMVGNLESIIRLSGKLVYCAVNNDESFLSELLNTALKQIKEADSGTVSVIDGERWKLIDAKGHDIRAIRDIELIKNNAIDFTKAYQDKEMSSVCVGLLENPDNFGIINLDSKTLEYLRANLKKPKQVLLAQFNYRGKAAGYISLEIAESSYKSFSPDAERVIEAFGNLASAFIAFQRLSELQQQMQAQIKHRLEEVENWNRTLEQNVGSRTKAVRNLLDNVGQGLMTFGRDFLIHREYSAECIRIFGAKVENKLFSDLIFPEDREEAGFVDQVLRELFETKDEFKAKVYLSMLPAEIILGSKYINLQYKVVYGIQGSEERAVMVVLTEITETRLLEDKLKEDERIIRMVANVTGNLSSFLECVRDFQYFYGSKLHEILDSSMSVSDMYAAIFRYIHTFKGSFSQFEMYNSFDNLHSMESALSCLGSMIDSFAVKDLKGFVYSFDIIDFLEKDIDLLKEKLGTNLFSMGDSIQVEKSRLADIEKEILEICSPVECKTLLPIVKSLRLKSLKELLGTYPEYTIRLAERLEKSINPFAIEGDDIYVDSDKYGSFIKSLVHVFRNSVDHGFKAADEDMGNHPGKAGNISCHIEAADGYAKIVIEDDGAGIDYDKIREKAIEYELYDEEEVDALDKETLLPLIFRESFTTKNLVTDISGRGMGLPAVKAEIEKLGGKVEVYTKKDKGTKFCFLIPLMDVEQIERLKPAEFVDPIMHTTLDFLKERFQNRLEIIKIAPFNSGSFNMKNYTAFVGIKGLFDGSFAISMDNSIASSILKLMLLDNVDVQMEVKYTKDVIAECANMILGNSIKSYPNIKELIIIGTPNVIHSSSNDISYDGNLITGYVIETNQGTVIISIIQ